MTQLAYVDSSALVKLVLAEAESAALAQWIRVRDVTFVSSALSDVEVRRTAALRDDDMAQRVDALLGHVTLIAVDHDVLDAAIRVEPRATRALDAIHVATATRLADELAHFVTYDTRQAAAARSSGLDVVAPA